MEKSKSLDTLYFVGELTETHLSCPICLEIYRDPKILPCSHTFCLPCLKSLAGQNTNPGDKFQCPNCRKEVDVPEGGLQALTNNREIKNISEDVGAYREKKSSREQKCAQHEEMNYVMYCNQCSVCVCLSCISHEHSGHAFQLLEEARVNVEQEIKRKLQDIKTGTLERLNEFHDTITDEIKKYDKDEIEICDKIKERAIFLHAMIDEFESYASREVREIFAQQSKPCRESKDYATSHLATIHSVINHAQNVCKEETDTLFLFQAKDNNNQLDKVLDTPLDLDIPKRCEPVLFDHMQPGDTRDKVKEMFGTVSIYKEPEPEPEPEPEQVSEPESDKEPITATEPEGKINNEIPTESTEETVVVQAASNDHQCTVENQVTNETCSKVENTNGATAAFEEAEEADDTGPSIIIGAPQMIINYPPESDKYFSVSGLTSTTQGCLVMVNNNSLKITQFRDRSIIKNKTPAPVRSVCIDATGDIIYGVDSSNKKLYSFYARNGTIQKRESLNFQDPWGIATDKENSIYIAFRKGMKIQKRKNGEASFELLINCMGEPHNLCCTEKGEILVAEWSPKKKIWWINKYGEDGNSLWSCETDIATDHWFIVDIACDKSGAVFVTDRESHRILQVSSKGEFQGCVAQKQDGVGLPTAITVTDQNELVVACYEHSRPKLLIF